MATTARSSNELLTKQLESIVGAEHVAVAPEIELDGLKPAVLIRPGSCQEAAASLRLCGEMRAAVVPAGNMTWLAAGNPLIRADVVLSLSRMNRVIEYSPPDLTATLEAGSSFREFNLAAAAEKQWLPLDPPATDSASMGAIVACASSGPLRFGYGTPRDYVIGLHLAHVDGKESKSGGKVVKNVAGYDMNKLYTGSVGTLAVITEVTVKLRPLPEVIATVAVSCSDAGPLWDLASNVSMSTLRPVSQIMVNGSLSLNLGLEQGYAFLVRFAGGAAEVSHQVGVFESMAGPAHATKLSDEDSTRVWDAIANIDRSPACAMKISVLRTRLRDAYASCEAVSESIVAADAGMGTIMVAFDAGDDEAVNGVSSLRSMAESLGGTAFLEKAPLSVRRRVDSWGDPGPAADLMGKVKKQLDPDSILNPGKFINRM